MERLENILQEFGFNDQPHKTKRKAGAMKRLRHGPMGHILRAKLRIEERERRKRLGPRIQKYNKAKRNARSRERYRTDKAYNLERRLRAVVGASFSRGGLVSRERASLILGCNIHAFKAYIESLWLPGMSWDNYGLYSARNMQVWNLDHIVPIAAFHVMSDDEVKRCFHYSNYQPVWAMDNFKKGSLYKGYRIRRNNNKDLTDPLSST